MKSRLLILYPLCLALSAAAQTPGFENSLKQYSSQYEQERIHMHFDKDVYMPGETVWIKAYIMAGSKPSPISRNIYFDWTDEKGTLLMHTASPVMEGSAAASFAVPMGFTGSALHLRAYTQWMLNFDNEFLYNKDIPVLAAWDGNIPAADKPQVTMQLFPEGGDLVDGLSSVIAFEALDQHGIPASVKGTVVNAAHQVVDSFYSVHDGMGSFRLKPAAGETYSLLWHDEYGQTHQTDLPKRKNTGAVLRITATGDYNIHYQVERASDAPENLKSFTLVGTTHQQVVFRSTIDLKNKAAEEGTISTMQASGSVMQLTLLDESMIPVAERLVFVRNYQPTFETLVKNNAVDLSRRGKNEFSIEVPDSLGADLSVSVTDGNLGTDTENNILSDFLLSSEIRGHVKDPAWYFSSNSDSAKLFLDLVMRTHGWRRFNWEQVVSGKLPALTYTPDSDFISLKGKIGPALSRFEPGDSISLLLIGNDRKKWVAALPIQPDGSFTLRGLFFYDSLQVVYAINHTTRLAPGASVVIETGLRTEPVGTVKADIPAYKWTRVPDLVLERETNGVITEPNNYGRQLAPLDYVFTPVRTDSTKSNAQTATKYLLDNFPGYHFPTGQEDHTASGPGRFASYTSAPRNNVNLLVDGNPATLEDLKQVSMKEVLFIKFMQKASPKDLPALSITTRQSVVQENIMTNKTGFAILRGYAGLREFYVPPVATPGTDEAATDYRTTLYWNPRVILDKNHRKATVSFYNNDKTNKYRIVIEGINKQGKMTRLEEIVK